MHLTAIYPGTFDPIPLGHLDIIERAARIFPKLIVGVAIDNNKNTLFSIEERVALVEHEVAMLDVNSHTQVMPFRGLLVDFAIHHNANVIIRGLRAASDFEYEFQLSYMNHKLTPQVETVFIPATEKSHFIASRFVREIGRLGGKLEGFATKSVIAALKKKYEGFV